MAQIFALAEDFGVTTSYEFKNDINESLQGVEYINALWKYPVAKYNFSLSHFHETEKTYLVDFFNFHNGSSDLFLFIDPIDYYSTWQEFDTGLGVKTQGVVIEEGGQFQLAKKYMLDDTYIVYRPVNRPKDIEVFDSVTQLPAIVTVDADTGIITSGGVSTLVWEGDFYTAVRFENDKLPIELESFDKQTNQYSYKCSDLRLIEVREPHLNSDGNIASNYPHVYSLDLYYDTDIGKTSKTDVFTGDSGYEDRTYLSSNKKIMDSPTTLVHKQQKEYLIGLYRLCLGTFGTFQIQDSFATIDSIFRFKEALNFQLLVSADNGDYQPTDVSGLSFVEDVNDEKTFLCQAWRISRTDATILGFTNHDNPILCDGTNCESNAGFIGTNSQKTSELNVDSTEITSSFNAILINENDLLAGKYENAGLKIYLFDWKAKTIFSVTFNGTLGGYSTGFLASQAKTYQIEGLSISEKLDAATAIETSSECRFDFLSQGNEGSACNRTIDTNVQVASTLTGIIAANILQIGTGLDDWSGYVNGIVEFTSGNLSGTKFYIIEATGLSVTLLYAPSIPPDISSTVLMTRGCSKTVEACDNYSNLENYGAQPRLPGLDVTITSPV